MRGLSEELRDRFSIGNLPRSACEVVDVGGGVDAETPEDGGG
jgi:hypothetical protein